MTILLLMTLPASAAELSLIFRPEATFEQRAAELARLEARPVKKVLPLAAGIAELCHQADVCAQATTSDIGVQCEHQDEDAEDAIDDTCFIQRLRTDRLCDPNARPLTVEQLALYGRAANEAAQVYRASIVDAAMMPWARRTFPEMIGMEPDDITDYVETHPAIGNRLNQMSQDAYGLGQYTMSCHEKMNQLLFSNDAARLERYYRVISGTINSLDLYPKFRGKVNRGINLPPAVLQAHHRIGNVVCYNGFTSTAIHDPIRDYSNRPRNIFLGDKCAQRLYINYANNGAVPGTSIDAASASRGEREILFPPGSCFRIDAVSERTDAVPAEQASEICEPGARYNFEMTLVPRP